MVSFVRFHRFNNFLSLTAVVFTDLITKLHIFSHSIRNLCKFVKRYSSGCAQNPCAEWMSCIVSNFFIYDSVCVLCLLKNLFYLCLMNTNEVIMIWNASKRIYYFVTILLRKVVGEIVFFFCTVVMLSSPLLSSQKRKILMELWMWMLLSLRRSGGFAIAEHIYFSLIKAHTRDSKRNALISTEKAHKTHTHTRTTFHEAYPCTKTARRIFMSCMQSKFWVIRCRIIWTVFSLCLSLCTFQEYSSWMCVCVPEKKETLHFDIVNRKYMARQLFLSLSPKHFSISTLSLAFPLFHERNHVLSSKFSVCKNTFVDAISYCLEKMGVHVNVSVCLERIDKLSL